jgi:hypothetical protein
VRGAPARGKGGASTVVKFALLPPLASASRGWTILVRSSNGGNVHLHKRAVCRNVAISDAICHLRTRLTAGTSRARNDRVSRGGPAVYFGSSMSAFRR